MAGGIGKPFEFNIKCIIFVVLLMIAYYKLPDKNEDVYNYIPIVTTLFVLLYYYLYSCKNSNIIILLLVIAITSIILRSVYWHIPRGLWTAYYFIFFIGYVALAYFDYLMDCEIPLQAGLVSFTHLFKPHKQNT